jgi:hypothetical protein
MALAFAPPPAFHAYSATAALPAIRRTPDVRMQHPPPDPPRIRRRWRALAWVLFAASFLPYLLPMDERPAAYVAPVRTSLDRRNRRFLGSHLDAVPWED